MRIRALSQESAHRVRDTGRFLGRRSRDERGSILVLAAIFITLFLVTCAVVVDVGYWWANAKKAQIAADACALAAAQSLNGTSFDPSSGKPDPLQGECRIEQGGVADAGPDYVFQNIPPQGPDVREPKWAGTVVEWPYEKSPGVFDNTMVEATVHMKVGTFFGRIVGLHGINVTRRAVAEQAKGESEVTIHGHDTNCGNDNIIINGKNNTVGGIIESNGKFEWNGENFTSGPATAGGPNHCLIKVNGPGASFGGQPAPANDPSIHPWPWYFVRWEDGLDCDFTGQNLVFDTENGVIDDQIYCATESIEVKKPMSGKVTFIAPRININAENTDFSPSTAAMNAGKPLLFFHIPNSTPSQTDDLPEPFCEHRHEMILNGLGAKWTGIIFNPCDRIKINGDQNSSISALIEAMAVTVNGEKFNIDNFPFEGGEVELNLVE